MEDATVSYLCQQEKYDSSCEANVIDERAIIVEEKLCKIIFMDNNILD